MCLEMSKREQRCLGGHLISLDKIGAAEWLGDKGKGRRKTAGRAERCVSGGIGLFLQLNVYARVRVESSSTFHRDAPSIVAKGAHGRREKIKIKFT